MLALARLFAGDYADGTWSNWRWPRNRCSCLLGKIVAHWLVTGVPLR
jgi:ABC-type transport system involved in cytochrome c biogenesis permease component